MFLSRPAHAGLLALCVVLAALSGCHARRDRAANKDTPETLYKKAHKSLDSYDFNAAIKSYEKLTASFPFAAEARQARLDLIYAYYRAGEKESATDAADTFIRENPTHPRVDYAYYMKGLVEFERTPNAIESLFRADLSQRPPTTARKSFAAFKTVVEQYPKSAYAHDALQRMVYLRDRLASYEVHVARFYFKRNAYIAAAQRARAAIDLEDVVLVYGDEAERRIEQELRLADQEGGMVTERCHIARHGAQARACLGRDVRAVALLQEGEQAREAHQALAGARHHIAAAADRSTAARTARGTPTGSQSAADCPDNSR